MLFLLGMKCQENIKGFIVIGLLIFSTAIRVDAKTFDLAYSDPDARIPREYLEIYEDKTGKLVIADFISGNYKDSFQLVEDEYNYNHNIHSYYWLKFSIKNSNLDRFKKWVLEFHDPHITSLILFKSYNGRWQEMKPVGFGHRVSNKEYNHKNLVFDIVIDSGMTDTYYVKINSKLFSSFSFSIRSNNFFTDYALKEYYLLGIYYGVILIMALYNLFLFFTVKERVYLMYVLYVIACGFNSFSEDGIGFQYLWPEVPWFNDWVMNFTPLILLVTFVLYSRDFLKISYFIPSMMKYIYGTTILFFMNMLLELTVLPKDIKLPFYILPFLLIYIAAIRIYFSKHYKPARFFILGYSFIIISFLIFILRSNGVLPGTIFFVYNFNFGFVIEVVILSIALGDKIRLEKEEREKAQNEMIVQYKETETLKNRLIDELKEKEILKDKVNRELEQKVAERTIELETKSKSLEDLNIKLNALSENLKQMNIQLDMDNWQLKKKIQEEKKARIVSEEVTLEEFSNIFPDQSACYRYLEEVKWSAGFTCKKCGNQSYSEVGKPFNRKCTRCKNPESVTAYTLFHALKFPIEKAFFIVHDTFMMGDKRTIDELSSMIDLRRNTCWSFRKKVIERMKNIEKRTGGKEKITWEKLFVDE